MAEKALFFTTGGAGDGASTYTEGEWTALWRELLCYDEAAEGLCIASLRYPTPLEVSAGVGKVTVAAGRAVTYGYMYWNTAPVDVAIPTPVGATRIDRIVLRVLYASGTRTVRITRLPGVEGGAAPEIEQDPGTTTWDIKLAQVSVTTGGVITVTNERVYLHPNWMVATRNLDDGAVTAEKLAAGAVVGALGVGGVTPAEIADRSRRFLVCPCWAKDETSGTHLEWGGVDDAGWNMPDGKKCAVGGSFLVPADYVSDLCVYAVVHPQGAGNLYAENVWRSTGAWETMPQHGGGTGYAAVAVQNDIVADVQQLTPGDYVVAGEYVALRWTRDAANAADTVNAAVQFLGWLVTYEADG